MLTARVAADLGVQTGAKVQAELYKLLLYQEGDHFVPHRDTEKAPGMFATMTLLLPCMHEVHTFWHLCSICERGASPSDILHSCAWLQSCCRS